MKKGFLGQYTYISMTKVDIYEHEGLDIKSTAVHEYIHSYLVRGTLYGQFMLGIEQANLIDNKYNEIISKLYENEERLQEATATLIELLYVWYKKGLSAARADLNELPYPYNKYIEDYKHFFNSGYVIKVYKQYLKYINQVIEDNKEDHELCEIVQNFTEEMHDDTNEKSALNLMLYLILKVAEFAMTVDMKELDGSLWDTPKKITKYIRNQYAEKYYPNTRFKNYMKHVFSEKSQNIDRFSLNGVVSFPKEYYADNLFNVDNYILERYKEGNIEVQNLMKNKLKENGYIQRPHLNKINKLEQEAIMYAQPYPLNKESAEKLFGNAFWVDDADIDQKDIKQVIDSSKIIHIHPSTGKEDQYSYDISVNSIFNPETVKTSKVNKVLQASCTIRNLEELLVLIQDYIGILYITGCHRSKKLLDELKSRGKDNKIYINSVASLTSSIEFINEHFNGNEAEIVQTKYCDILLMKNSKYVFFQYLLPGSQEILQKAISEQRICLKRLIFSQKCTLLKQIEWDRIENFTEEYFKECCTYMAKKSW